MSSTVRIPWNIGDTIADWNEACGWAIEYFGLPGARYVCRIGDIYMDFVFKSNKDALVMAIMWNAQIVPDNELTVEHVGKLLQ